MKIYLAHPISGMSGPETFGYFQKLKAKLEFDYEILCPMTGKGEMRTEQCYAPHGYTNPVATDKAIKGRDQWMVRQADVVLVDFTGAKDKSIGCCMELAWADLLGKHTVLVLDEIHKHAFVVECADIVFETLDQAVGYLIQLAEQ